jgi:hypothetical protein
MNNDCKIGINSQIIIMIATLPAIKTTEVSHSDYFEN